MVPPTNMEILVNQTECGDYKILPGMYMYTSFDTKIKLTRLFIYQIQKNTIEEHFEILQHQNDTGVQAND